MTVEEAIVKNDFDKMIEAINDGAYFGEPTVKKKKKYNRLDMVKYAFENGFTPIKKFMETAIIYDSIDIVKLCRQYNGRFTSDMYKHGNVETLRYLNSSMCNKCRNCVPRTTIKKCRCGGVYKNCPTFDSSIYLLERRGRDQPKNTIEIMEYLQSIGIPWHLYTICNLFGREPLDVIVYLFEHGCPFPSNLILSRGLVHYMHTMTHTIYADEVMFKNCVDITTESIIRQDIEYWLRFQTYDQVRANYTTRWYMCKQTTNMGVS